MSNSLQMDPSLDTSLEDVIAADPPPCFWDYSCNPQELPGPLPTLDKIHAAESADLKPHIVGGKRIVIVRGLFVVKYGPSAKCDGNEGHALMALAGIPTIPKVYAMFSHESLCYQITQHIHGFPLDFMWHDMSPQERTDVMHQLRVTFDQVRSRLVPLPPTFCSIIRGPVPHRFFASKTQHPDLTGPFVDEAAFHNAIPLNLHQGQVSSGMPTVQSEFLLHHFSQAMEKHACVFTHGNLRPENIRVQEYPLTPKPLQTPRPRRLIISMIEGWDDAAYMPAYWEYASSAMSVSAT
ncbi:phosphotransferase enzyme family protein [Sarocladium implicatum]|nr:phosphotransferase enzyme family protein [Sarocladium implicatum]